MLGFHRNPRTIFCVPTYTLGVVVRYNGRTDSRTVLGLPVAKLEKTSNGKFIYVVSVPCARIGFKKSSQHWLLFFCLARSQ